MLKRDDENEQAPQAAETDRPREEVTDRPETDAAEPPDATEAPAEAPHADAQAPRADRDEAISEDGDQPSLPDDPAEQIRQGLEAFGTRLDQHLADTASCSRSAFDRLYEEMRQYKDNFMLEVQRGLLVDVLILYDSINKVKQFVEDTETIDGTSMAANLEGLLVEAEEILIRRGIEPLYETSEKLDIRTQKAVRVVSTDDPDEDMRVVDRLKKGFICGDRAFRKEEVTVKKYAPPVEPSRVDEAAVQQDDATDGPQSD